MSKRVTNDSQSLDYKYPRSYFFPPFFTLQPNTTTRNAQFEKWSSFILSYCRHHRIWRLSIIDALDMPLFHNSELRKRLSLHDAREVVDWMTRQEGSERAEWIGKEGEKSVAWIYWRRPEEWAEVLGDWVGTLFSPRVRRGTELTGLQVEETGQKNTVLTLYELTEGETASSAGELLYMSEPRWG